MRVLFPSQPFEAKLVDGAFEGERQAARDAGLEAHLVDSEALDAGSFDRAVRRLPEIDDDEVVVYRGWMLTAASYAGLHEALARRHYVLVNDPDEYAHAHLFPGSYPVIRDHTPRSVWTEGGAALDLPAVMQLLAPFGDVPIVVKDHVKSQKHYWHEACFIPSARDPDAVLRVVTRFIELQGDSLTGGLVFRELVALEPLATHSRSGMPLTKEFRIFFLDGRPLLSVWYWEEGEYHGERPPDRLFHDVAARVRSRFFTMDVARGVDGRWMIMELGDGQVAGLPARLDPMRFYEALAAAFR